MDSPFNGSGDNSIQIRKEFRIRKVTVGINHYKYSTASRRCTPKLVVLEKRVGSSVVEQRPFKPLAAGSIPARPTNLREAKVALRSTECGGGRDCTESLRYGWQAIQFNDVCATIIRYVALRLYPEK